MSKIAEVAGNAEDVKYYKASVFALSTFVVSLPYIDSPSIAEHFRRLHF